MNTLFELTDAFYENGNQLYIILRIVQILGM